MGEGTCRPGRARWVVARIAAGAAVAVVAGLLWAPAAQAAPTVGECYALSAEQARAGGWWPDASAVPCTQAHTFQVTEVGLIPADVDSLAFAADQCGSLDVWARLGVNPTVAGVVRHPVRIEARSFGLREMPPTYVCGAVLVGLNGRGSPTVVPLDAPVERLGRRSLAALRYCTSAQDDRGARAPMVSVPCSTRPRWEVSSWVVWTAFFDENPGRAALRARAEELCGAEAVFTLPSPGEWKDGLPRTWCFVKVP